MEMRFSGSNLVLDWGESSALTSSTSFVSGRWYFIAVAWNEYSNHLELYVGDQDNPPVLDAYNNYWSSSVSNLGVTQNNFLASKGGVEPVNGHGDELRYWTTDRSLTDIQSNYNAQLAGNEANLRSYFKLDNNFVDSGPAGDNASASGSYSFQTDTPFNASSETLMVDVWYGGGWHNVIADVSNGWNNVSVASYLTSSTFTIRFKGGSETGDDTQDRWNIDAVLLHVWSDQYTVEVEVTGSGNADSWTQLNWTTNMAWTVGSVSVTIQLYNYTAGAYQTSGFGYLTYTSSGTANTDENGAQSTSVNTSDFKNSTGAWKLKITGVKATTTQFDLKADFAEFNVETKGGTLVTVENDGGLSCHVVSIWVLNSTVHQRFDADWFVDSGETASQTYPSINLPSGSYTIKVATERGNLAILTSS